MRPGSTVNRTPMLLSIHTGFVEGYSGDQTTVIYLQTTIGILIENAGNWCFTDGHAVDALTEFYNDLNDLETIYWDLIQSWSWKNTPEDNDRKRRKQAEFLAESFVPWNAIMKIAVFDYNKLGAVREILDGASYLPETAVESNWYYKRGK